MNIEYKPLPVGSVVKLNGGDQNLVIVSLLPVTEMDGEQGYFDYGMAFLPNGLDGQKLVFANNENIQEIVYIGFIDVYFQSFVENYDELVNEIEYKKLEIKEVVDVEENLEPAPTQSGPYGF